MTNVSVVIASIGESSLDATIEKLVNSAYRVEEIIVSVPGHKVGNITQYVRDNSRVVISPLIGQVNQRCYGFKQVSPKMDLVLQLDSDISVSPTLVGEMVKEMAELPEASALGLKICDGLRESDFMWKISRYKIFNAFFHFIVNGNIGFSAGMLSKTGINYPFIGLYSVTPVDWLAGGCLMHRRRNLICESFYDFEGKAYCEDLYHSSALIDHGITLYYSPKTSCQTGIFNQVGLYGGLRGILREFRIHYRFARGRYGVSRLRFSLIYILYYMSRTKF